MAFILRFAGPNDLNALIDFYHREHSASLPAPSPRAIGLAIAEYQLLVVTGPAGEIVATGGTFDVTPPTATRFVGELAGTRVTRAVGTRPVRMQTILLILRVLGFALGGFESPDPDADDTLIVLIRKDNDKSRRNILDVGFEPLHERPGWLQYDELSWNGKVSADAWDYYYATPQTALRCALLYFEYGLQRGRIELTAGDRRIAIEIQLPGFRLQEIELRMIQTAEHRVRFAPPPAQLALADRDDRPD